MEQQVNQSSTASLTQIMEDAGGIDKIYLVFVDIIKGFCEVGSLSSTRVNEMVQPVVELAEALQKHGLSSSQFVFLNDAHPENAVEFTSFAPHCVRGTTEAEVVDALRTFQDQPETQTFLKNATNGLFGTNKDGQTFHEWASERLEKGRSTWMVVGDCTDLCIYQNAMGLRLLANERNAEAKIIVPIPHVRTYDLSITTANEIGAYAHDADFLDLVFLYHMKANGIELLSQIDYK